MLGGYDKNKNNNINNKYKNKNSLNKNEIIKSKNVNDYEFIKFPERIDDKRQNNFSNKKFLTIKVKNDKIQLKEKGIKINDI